jgi:hypothetical protein
MATIEYEPIWSGSTWRSFPAPVLATAIPRPVAAPVRKLPHYKQRIAARNRERVRALLGEEWISARDVQASVKLTLQALRSHLREAVADGYAERKDQLTSVRQSGEVICWYRRRQGQETSAA